ncbi:ABC transporter permease [Clostridium frigidicarnis]|uniref:ABC-2 family transporter protein n=1 Tax=Clostridium frigidicarnis TaxID=84698 RepID=A0A1I1AWQ0_9CLOT|nr:ABC transporter permease [Clostridium frigidicarnis]SFB41836.1 ABC-2 family transporter protein [Clostridium frigidicarnis]
MITVMNNEFIKNFKGSKKFGVFLFILIVLSITSTLVYKLADISHETYYLVMNTMTISLEIIPIYMATLTSDMLTEDYKNGTLKNTVLRPISRGNIILGKALFIVVSVMLLIIFNVIFSTFFSSIIFGNDMPSSYELIELLVRGILTAFILGAFGMVLIFISLFTNSSGVATGFGIGVLFGMKVVSVAFLALGILPEKFSGIFITNSFNMFANNTWTQDKVQFSISFIMVAAYYIVFSLLSIKAFEKKDILY